MSSLQTERDGTARAQRADADEFMAVAAHDVRNPIAVVRASAQMALRQIGRGDYEAARNRLQAVVVQTDRATEVLEVFVDAARIEADRLAASLRLERVDLLDTVQTAVDRAKTFLGEAGQRSVEVDVHPGCEVTWDRARTVRALKALLDNAFMYGDADEPVRISAMADGGMVRLRVSGGGPGPNMEESARLFERFFRGPTAAAAGFSGSGLGLYVARGIARAHGGDARAAPGAQGRADTFEIELPVTVGGAQFRANKS
jgi:two-component system, OmpR family, sensor kinase